MPQKKLELSKKLDDQEDGELKKLPAEVETPAVPVPARPAARSRPASQISTKSSRAKLRDSIMQVSNKVEEPASDPLKDPFDQSSPRLNRPGEKTDPTLEPEMPQTSPSDERSAPLPSANDPFPEDRIPVPPSEELPSYPQGPMDMPAEVGGCENDEKDCERAINELRRNTIDTIVVDIVIEGEGGLPPVAGRDYPCECRSGIDASFKPRAWSQTVFNWKATGVCHKPLYFEDVHLERYGHSWNPVAQPFMSAAHFFISVPLLPYKMGLNLPQECIYTLGYYRPGNCAPYLIDPIPFSLRAALFEGAAGVGFGYLFFPPAI